MRTFGTQLQRARKAANLSVRALAGKVKLSPAMVSDMELGRRYPSAATFKRIRECLGVDFTVPKELIRSAKMVLDAVCENNPLS